jgi:hypothetical protein
MAEFAKERSFFQGRKGRPTPGGEKKLPEVEIIYNSMGRALDATATWFWP